MLRVEPRNPRGRQGMLVITHCRRKEKEKEQERCPSDVGSEIFDSRQELQIRSHSLFFMDFNDHLVLLYTLTYLNDVPLHWRKPSVNF